MAVLVTGGAGYIGAIPVSGCWRQAMTCCAGQPSNSKMEAVRRIRN